MVNNCKKTCGICKNVVIDNCKDSLHSCAIWARLDYCVRTPRYMKRYCRASCGHCQTKLKTTKGPQATYSPGEKCFDISTSCTYWKRRGYCRPNNRFFAYVTKRCQKTCQVGCAKPTTIPLPPTQVTTTMTMKKILSKCGEDKRFDRPFEIGTIIDGNDAPNNAWIWQASLEYYDIFECGGTLITSHHVVTAAHCLTYRDKKGLEVILGDHRRDILDLRKQRRKIDKIFIHEKYDENNNDNDIAIIRLEKPVTLNEWVGVACLPNKRDLVRKSKCYVTGWGKIDKDGTAVNILQEGNLPMVDKWECKRRNVNSKGQTEITSNMFCAGTKNGTVSGCQGDSGGPYVCLSAKNKWVLQGAVSWGSSECDNKHKYTVFTKVVNYLDWINTILYERQ